MEPDVVLTRDGSNPFFSLEEYRVSVAGAHVGTIVRWWPRGEPELSKWSAWLPGNRTEDQDGDFPDRESAVRFLTERNRS